MKINRSHIAIIAGVGVVVLLGALMTLPWLQRKVLLPAEVHAPWVEELATSGTRLTGFAQWLPKMNEHNPLPAVPKANQQKLDLMRTYETRSGAKGLRRVSFTVHGDPTVTWLLVREGRVDYIRDRTAGRRRGSIRISRSKFTRITPGYFANDQFVKGYPPGEEAVLVLKLEGPGVDYFW